MFSIWARKEGSALNDENMGQRTERFFAKTQGDFATLKAWAESVGLSCTILELKEPASYRDGLFPSAMDIGPMPLADSALYSALDRAEAMFGYVPGNEGSFKVEIEITEDADDKTGKVANLRKVAA
jgi:hypothetical protein